MALDASLDEAARTALLGKLDAMDRRSEHGAWTRKTLALIAKHPRTAASKLAAKLGRDKLAFKADVVSATAKSRGSTALRLARVRR